MAPTAKRPAKAANPDFKRIKAKVGKRAPKSLNLTDTSFKAASLSLKTQSAVDSATEHQAGELYSSRGRSIRELSSQLQHPAPAVRLSAAKGLKDLVGGAQTSTSLLQAHLSTLLPSTAKCLVDEESDVRELGLAVLSTVIQRVSVSAMMPFGDLLLAFVSSALNSLDRGTRRDGAAAVQLLALEAPSLVCGHAGDLLPAFVRLLGEKSLKSKTCASTKTSKKRKRQAKPTGHEFSLLRALLYLLQSNKESVAESSATKTSYRPADLTVARGGRTRNSLLLCRSDPARRPRLVIQCLEDLSPNSHTRQMGVVMDWKVALALLERLRDGLMESSDLGQRTGSDAYYLATPDMESFLLTVQSIRILVQSMGSVSETDMAAGVKVCATLANLMLERFPLHSDGRDETLADTTNGEVSAAVLVLAKFAGKDKKKWIAKVADFTESALGSEPLGDTETHQVTDTTTSTMIVEVFWKLLKENHLSEMPSLKASMLDKFVSAFFADDVIHRTRARSSTGRESARIVCGLFEMIDYDLAQAKEQFGAALPMLSGISEYIIHWEGDYVEESAMVVSLLHHIIRRNETDQGGLFARLRKVLHQVVVQKRRSSIFERYPVHLQRLVVSMIVLLRKPLPETTVALSKLCARRQCAVDQSVSAPVVSFIIESVHSVRKTLSMQSYLAFVLDSMGLLIVQEYMLKPKKDGGDKGRLDWKRLVAFDDGIEEAIRYLTACGSAKVLPMIRPFLTTCLVPPRQETMHCDLLKLRAATVILAFLSMDLGGGIVFDILTDGFDSAVAHGVCGLLEHLPALDEAEESTINRWMHPVAALMAAEPSLLVLVSHDLSNKATNDTADKENDFTAILRGFLLILKHEMVVDVAVQSAAALLPVARDLASTLSRTAGEAPASRIVTELEMLQGSI